MQRVSLVGIGNDEHQLHYILVWSLVCVKMWKTVQANQSLHLQPIKHVLHFPCKSNPTAAFTSNQK